MLRYKVACLSSTPEKEYVVLFTERSGELISVQYGEEADAIRFLLPDAQTLVDEALAQGLAPGFLVLEACLLSDP